MRLRQTIGNATATHVAGNPAWALLHTSGRVELVEHHDDEVELPPLNTGEWTLLAALDDGRMARFATLGAGSWLLALPEPDSPESPRTVRLRPGPTADPPRLRSSSGGARV